MRQHLQRACRAPQSPPRPRAASLPAARAAPRCPCAPSAGSAAAWGRPRRAAPGARRRRGRRCARSPPRSARSRRTRWGPPSPALTLTVNILHITLHALCNAVHCRIYRAGDAMSAQEWQNLLHVSYMHGEWSCTIAAISAHRAAHTACLSSPTARAQPLQCGYVACCYGSSPLPGTLSITATTQAARRASARKLWDMSRSALHRSSCTPRRGVLRSGPARRATPP